MIRMNDLIAQLVGAHQRIGQRIAEHQAQDRGQQAQPDGVEEHPRVERMQHRGEIGEREAADIERARNMRAQAVLQDRRHGGDEDAAPSITAGAVNSLRKGLVVMAVSIARSAPHACGRGQARERDRSAGPVDADPVSAQLMTFSVNHLRHSPVFSARSLWSMISASLFHWSGVVKTPGSFATSGSSLALRHHRAALLEVGDLRLHGGIEHAR